MGLNITLCATSTLPCSCISGVSVKFQACHWPFPVSLRTWRCWCCCWGRMLDEKIGAGLTAHWSHPPATPNWAGGRHWISTSHWPPYSGTRDIWDSSMNQGFLLKANFFCVHNMSSFMHLLVEKKLLKAHIYSWIWPHYVSVAAVGLIFASCGPTEHCVTEESSKSLKLWKSLAEVSAECCTIS